MTVLSDCRYYTTSAIIVRVAYNMLYITVQARHAQLSAQFKKIERSTTGLLVIGEEYLMKLMNRLAKALAVTENKAGGPRGTPKGKPIQDRCGETFWLHPELYEDGGHVIWLGRPGQNVGCAKLYRDTPSSCVIGELKVSEQFRGRGLGTILLNEVFRLAKADKLEKVWAWVTLSDFLATKHLLEWYSRYGFEVRVDKAEIERLLALSLQEQTQLSATSGTRSVAQISVLTSNANRQTAR